MSSTGSGYDQSVSTYSPEGKLFQVEYAYKAVESSGTAVGVRCRDGVILAVEKLLHARLLVPGSGRRIATVDEHVGMAVAGLMPDARQLIARARDECKGYRTNFGEHIPPRTLNDRMGAYTHTFTSYWYLRPFGASALIAAYDAEANAPELYCVEPNGTALRYFGMALGKGARAAKTEIEKAKLFDLTVEEALGPVAKIVHGVHDDTKDKPFELEMSVISAATGWRHAALSKERLEAASAWAKAAIEREEMGDDDDDE